MEAAFAAFEFSHLHPSAGAELAPRFRDDLLGGRRVLRVPAEA